MSSRSAGMLLSGSWCRPCASVLLRLRSVESWRCWGGCVCGADLAGWGVPPWPDVGVRSWLCTSCRSCARWGLWRELPGLQVAYSSSLYFAGSKSKWRRPRYGSYGLRGFPPQIHCSSFTSSRRREWAVSDSVRAIRGRLPTYTTGTAWEWVHICSRSSGTHEHNSTPCLGSTPDFSQVQMSLGSLHHLYRHLFH